MRDRSRRGPSCAPAPRRRPGVQRGNESPALPSPDASAGPEGLLGRRANAGAPARPRPQPLPGRREAGNGRSGTAAPPNSALSKGGLESGGKLGRLWPSGFFFRTAASLFRALAFRPRSFRIQPEEPVPPPGEEPPDAPRAGETLGQGAAPAPLQPSQAGARLAGPLKPQASLRRAGAPGKP